MERADLVDDLTPTISRAQGDSQPEARPEASRETESAERSPKEGPLTLWHQSRLWITILTTTSAALLLLILVCALALHRPRKSKELEGCSKRDVQVDRNSLINVNNINAHDSDDEVDWWKDHYARKYCNDKVCFISIPVPSKPRPHHHPLLPSPLEFQQTNPLKVESKEVDSNDGMIEEKESDIINACDELANPNQEMILHLLLDDDTQ